MTPTPLLTDVQRYLETNSLTGVIATRLEIVDDVAELTLAFTPEALQRVLRAELRATGGPCDWHSRTAPMDPGSPTWAFALELAELFNEQYFKRLVFERLEDGLELLLALHGHEGTPIVLRPAYTPDGLMLSLRRLKAEQRGSYSAPWEARAA